MMFEWELECVTNIACVLQEPEKKESQALVAAKDVAQDVWWVCAQKRVC